MGGAEIPVPERMPTLAILPWGNVIEDFLDDVGVTLEEFATSMTGGWLFGYIEALRRSGIHSTVFCVSSRLQRMTRYSHVATGATVCVLPVPRSYAALRVRFAPRNAARFRGWDGSGEAPHATYSASRMLRNVVDYLATPARHLARELRLERCGAILCQEYEYPRFDVCVALGALLDLPVYATFQGGDWQNGRIERLIRSRSIRRSAGLIVPTSTEASRVEQCYGNDARICRIFNPIDIAQWLPADRAEARAELGISQSAEVAIWHGRVDIPRKGLDVLVDAWRRVVGRHPARELQLLLVGSGMDAAELARRLAAQPVTGVHWHNDYLLDRGLIRRYLSAADAYVFPSRHEGFPVAPLEAMACGLPVVAAAADGVADIFENGAADGGIVVSPGDAVALADGLESLLLSTVQRRELGQAARRRVEAAFSLEVVGRQLAATLFPPPGDIVARRRLRPGPARIASATTTDREST